MSLSRVVEKCVDTVFAYAPRSKPSLALIEKTCLVAHRGAHHKRNRILENTHASFEQAVALQCGAIEFDVHACKDEILVVNHDADLQRLWGKTHAIADLEFQQVRQVAPLVPSLDEIVTRYGQHTHLFIELKYPFTASEALAQSLKSLTPCVDYHLLSLHEELFLHLPQFPKQAFILVPTYRNNRNFCRISLEQHYGGVAGHYLCLTNELIQPLKSAQQIVGVGFVNSQYSLYRELSRGIPYLFSNNVETVSHYLKLLRKKAKV